MGKSKPSVPDPRNTAKAQTSSNIATAQANAALGMVNQYGPNSSLTYDKIGMETITDPSTGMTYQVPRYGATVSMNPISQRINHQNNVSTENLAQAAARQSQYVRDNLSGGINTNALPAINQIAGAGNVVGSFAGGGNIRDDIGTPRIISRNIADAGNIQNRVNGQDLNARAARGGQITRTYGGDFSNERNRVEQALMERMKPYLDQEREAMNSQLANQGINLGSDAYSAAQSDYSRSANDARLGAILSAGQEQSRLNSMEAERAAFQNSAQQQAFGQDFANIGQQADILSRQFQNDLSAGQFRNTAQQQQFGQNLATSQFLNQAQQQDFDQKFQRAQFGNAAQQQRFNQNQVGAQFANDAQQQRYDQEIGSYLASIGGRESALNEQMATRGQSYQELAALLNGGQLQQPSFNNIGGAAQMPNVDMAGLINQAYQGQLSAYNQRQSTFGSLLGTAGTLGAALLSDRRAKENIQRVGEYGRLPVYSYTYKGETEPQIGFMSDEVRTVAPDAVFIGWDGLDRVDYDKAMEKA